MGSAWVLDNVFWIRIHTNFSALLLIEQLTKGKDGCSRSYRVVLPARFLIEDDSAT